jgi:hypothetical protein
MSDKELQTPTSDKLYGSLPFGEYNLPEAAEDWISVVMRCCPELQPMLPTVGDLQTQLDAIHVASAPCLRMYLLEFDMEEGKWRRLITEAEQARISHGWNNLPTPNDLMPL